MVSTPSTGVPVAARPATLLLILIASLSPLTMHIYLPSLPGLAADLQANDAEVQLTLSVYLFAVAVGQLVIGPLSDRFGRKPVLIAGMLLFLLATAFCRFATSIDALIVGRAFQAIGGCTGMVLSRAIVRDVSDRNNAASMLGYVTMGMAIAQMMGPAIGGVLDGFYGWRASFDLLFLTGLAVLIASLFSLRETNLNPQTSLSPRALWLSHVALAREPRLWAFASTTALASAVFFAFLGGGPIISQREMGLTPIAYGLYFTLIAAGYAFGNFLSGRFSQRAGPPAMILYGNLLSLAAISSMALMFAAGFINPLALFGPMLLSSLANGLCLPSAFSGALSVRPDLAGTASGMTGSLQLAVGALATVVVGSLLHLGIWPLVFIMLGLAIAALAAGIVSSRLEQAAAKALD
ncbi:MAG: multidrug effflux MFS transporter [Pseudomonadota bacterium]